MLLRTAISLPSPSLNLFRGSESVSLVPGNNTNMNKDAPHNSKALTLKSYAEVMKSIK